jgi:KUP system potassium uptake protein
METHSQHRHVHTLSAAGVLVTLGIIYGDIGTSPLYVMSAIFKHHKVTSDLVLGGISCVFWTLTIQTTIKYILLTLQADNNGEGGIFSLFALVKKLSKGLLFVAMIGGATLLADGIITPPITVSAAVEGINIYAEQMGSTQESVPQAIEKSFTIKPQESTLTISKDEVKITTKDNITTISKEGINAVAVTTPKGIPTIPIVIAIITLIFAFQRFGTNIVGKAFGPIMFLWFSMLAVLGLGQIVQNPSILGALSPVHAFNFIVNVEGGFLLLGAVFLCTTGAEALYSDLGHCGRENIRVSWIFVKTSLLLNYLGQGVWLLKNQGMVITSANNPFYKIMPDWFLLFGIIIATLAAIIASQALISGSFTLIGEAVRLNLYPKVRVIFPTDFKGQIYIPSVNLFLWMGCIGIVLWFKESSEMEAAYGLAITITMLMTTVLLSYYLRLKRVNPILIGLFALVFLTVEGAFLIANLDKFSHGGYVTVLVASFVAFLMWVWVRASHIKKKLQRYVRLEEYLDQLKALSHDESLPKYATNLVFMSKAKHDSDVEEKIMYSILQKQPKRADIYWFVNIETTNEPFTMEYKVNILAPDDVIRVRFRLGFRVQQRISMYLRSMIEEMVKNGEVNITSRYHSLKESNVAGDFRFVIIEDVLSTENKLPFHQQFILSLNLMLKSITAAPVRWFGLDTSLVEVEKVPLIISRVQVPKLKRVQ